MTKIHEYSLIMQYALHRLVAALALHRPIPIEVGVRRTSRESRQMQPNSLLNYSKNVYSQRGDDGIIERIFEILAVERGFFVEFGAWDGVYLSNCRYLFENGWTGVYIEPDRRKYEQLQKNYRNHDKIICINEFVTTKKTSFRGRTFDAIADEYFPNQRIDFLSIDIDGLDYNVFRSIRRKPTVVCVEGGFSWHPFFTRKVPDFVASKGLQQPLAVMISLGRTKGYEPVCFNQNTYFVDKDLFYRFWNIQNDPITLWKDAWHHETEEFRMELTRFRKNNFFIEKIEEGNPAEIDLTGD